MKNLKKVFGTLALVIMAVLTLNVNADTVYVAEVDGTKYQTLSAALATADTKTLKLLVDLDLDSEVKIDSGKTITIDLNGHKLTAPQTIGYAINNEGTLTIQDTSAGKTGEVIGNSKSAAVRNYGVSLTIDGIKVTTKFIGIKNEEKTANGEVPKLVVKNTTIDKENLAASGCGIQLCGNATIENVTFYTPKAGSHRFILVLPAPDASEKTDVSIKGVNISRGKGHLTSGSSGVEFEGTAEISLEDIGALGLTVDTTAKESTTFEPAADAVEKVLSEAKSISGAKVVIPDDYKGEIPESEYITYVNEKGTEVVYVTFNGVRYDVEKGQNWTNNKALMGAIVDAQTVIGKNLVRYVDTEGKTVDKNTTFNKDTEIRAIYELTVKIATKDGDVTLKVEEGTSLADQTGSNKEKLDAIRANKFRRLETTDGKSFGSTTKITSNLDLKVVYYVTVTVDKSVYFIDEGTSLLDNADIFKGLKEVEGKTFEKFVTTKDGKDFSEETKINEDVELTMVFKTEEEEPPVVEEEVTPPPTLDNVISYVIALVVGLMVVGTASFILIKKNREN